MPIVFWLQPLLEHEGLICTNSRTYGHRSGPLQSCNQWPTHIPSKTCSVIRVQNLENCSYGTTSDPLLSSLD